MWATNASIAVIVLLQCHSCMPLLIIDYEGWLLERQDDDFQQRTCPCLPPTNLQHTGDRFMAGDWITLWGYSCT